MVGDQDKGLLLTEGF